MVNKTIVNIIYNNIFILSGILFPVLTFPYVTRILGPEPLGVVNLALSISTIFVMLMQVGIPVYGIKAMSKVRQLEEKRKIFWTLIYINIITGLVSSAIYCVFVIYFGYFDSEPILYMLIVPSLLLGFTSVDWYFASNEDFKSIAIRTLVLRLFSLIFLFSFVNASGDYKIYAGIIIYGGLISNAILFLMAWRNVGFRIPNIKIIDIKKHVHPLKYLLLTSVVASLYGSFDMLLIEKYWGAEYVGYYSIDRRLTLIIIALIGSFSLVLIPKMTRSIESGYESKFKSLFSESIFFLYVLNLPVILFVYIYSEEVILAFAGEGFLSSIDVLKVLSLQILFNSASNLLNVQVLMPLSQERVIFNSSAFGLLVNVVLGFLLIPSFNIIGAAIALVCSEFVVFSIRLRVAIKCIGLNYNIGYIKATIFSVGLFVIFEFIQKTVLIENFYLRFIFLLLFVSVSSMVYIYALYCKVINDFIGFKIKRHR
ncbi:TPA: flippase [Vibrio parahaemolyticus]|uniref:flippase n=1 Tax=Vibrio parahaemolyticus TaxID=670 RepID=UPI00084B0772|nr:flippase [Vibrio parahaemolyticus]ELA8196172.1 flippase [Vibrio parahaemolyticus]ODY15945.1 hypothetical protein BBM16_12835 [Vibrio parahaemolyticus]